MDQPRIEILCLLFVPVVMAAVVAALGAGRANLVRWLSLATSLLVLGLAASVTWQLVRLEETPGLATVHQLIHTPQAVPTFRPEFVPGSPSTDPTMHSSHFTTWNIVTLGPRAIQFYLGVDGINIWLVMLTAVLFVPSVLVSWKHIDNRVNEFYAWLLALQTALFGVFLAFDIILFYIFFELSLIPLFFLIGIWGGAERRYAARKFFLYTLVGSLITLLGVIGIVLACYSRTGELSFSLPRLVEIVHTRLGVQEPTEQAYWHSVQVWIFLALAAGFAVKVPLFPLHTWLPLAHVEAPTAGSVDLAGILLKIGAYGFLRLCIPLAPDASMALGLPIVSTLAVIGIIYGAFCAYSQDDMKRLVAYSSVSHVGLLMLGMFALNTAGLSGSLLQMINHGLTTGALFLLVGMLYERYHTRKISDYSGMASRLPLLGCFMVFMCLSSVGLPGLNNFVGEVLVLTGVFSVPGKEAARFLGLGIAATSGMILGAWYLLTMTYRSFFGPLKEPVQHDPQPIRDLSLRELTAIVPLAILCIALGVYPQPFLDASRGDLSRISDIAAKARFRYEHTTTPMLSQNTSQAPVLANGTEKREAP
jgi:NADH-quinone oxidoreductase subunit M